MNRWGLVLAVSALLGPGIPAGRAQPPLTLYCTDNRDGTITCQNGAPLSPLICSRNRGGTLSCRGGDGRAFTCTACSGGVVVCRPDRNGRNGNGFPCLPTGGGTVQCQPPALEPSQGSCPALQP